MLEQGMDRVRQLLKEIREMNETLQDLIAGCLVYSLVFELVGLLVIGDRAAWTLGILTGTVTAIVLSISMYRGIDSCLSLPPEAAARAMRVRSFFRLVLMMAALLAGLKLKEISMAAVLVGILGLKVSAHLHMYTHIYITGRIRRKGR